MSHKVYNLDPEQRAHIIRPECSSDTNAEPQTALVATSIVDSVTRPEPLSNLLLFKKGNRYVLVSLLEGSIADDFDEKLENFTTKVDDLLANEASKKFEQLKTG